jgi:hypothetical protein
MAYGSGLVTVGTAATLICTPGPSGVMVQNLGAGTPTLGGPSVAVGTGVTLAPSQTVPVLIPSGVMGGTVGDDRGLYGRVASGTTTVAFLGAV